MNIKHPHLFNPTDSCGSRGHYVFSPEERRYGARSAASYARRRLRAQLATASTLSFVGPVHIVTNTCETNCDVLTTKQNKAAIGTAANTIVSQYDYTINVIGQRTVRSQSGTAFTTSSTDTFSYNTRGEVTSSANARFPANDRLYSYDPIGNRLATGKGVNSATVSFRTYISNALNQYTQINTTQPTPPSTAVPIYDDDSNILADGAGKIYSWDCENRLIQVTLPNGEIIKYYYDFASHRIKREHFTSSSTETTTYFYDAWNVIYENTTSATGVSVVKTYLWGLDLSNTPQGAGGVGGLLLSKTSTGDAFALYSHLYDANGNVSELLTAAADIIAHYEYDSSGKISFASGIQSTVNAYRFSTKSADDAIDSIYYGYRIFLPSLGRWLSRDPLGEIGGINLFCAAKNDIINFYDINGLISSVNPATIAQLLAAGMKPAEIAEMLGISLQVVLAIEAQMVVNKAIENFQNNAKGRNPCEKAKDALRQAEKGIRKLEEIIRQHDGYIKDPSTYPNLSQEEVKRKGGIEKVKEAWRDQIKKQTKQKETLEKAREKLQDAVKKACRCWYKPSTWF